MPADITPQVALQPKAGWWEGFIDSPANRTGLVFLAGTAATAAAQFFLLHQTPSSADLIGLVVGALKIWAPDNSVTQAQLGKTMADVLLAIKTPSITTFGTVISDGTTITGELTSKGSI